jgi:hypothetical protein
VVLAFLTIGISPAIAVDTESTIKAAESEWKLINQNK